MRKTTYEVPLTEVIETMPAEVILAGSNPTGGLDDYNPGGWNWGV